VTITVVFVIFLVCIELCRVTQVERVVLTGFAATARLPWQNACTWFYAACNCIRVASASVPAPGWPIWVSYTSDENLCWKAI